MFEQKNKEDYPGYTEVCHPEIFTLEAMPEQPKCLKPGQLPEAEIKDYFEKVLHV